MWILGLKGLYKLIGGANLTWSGLEEVILDRGTNFVGGERELRESLEKWKQHQIEHKQLQVGYKINGVFSHLLPQAIVLKSIMGTQMVTEAFLHTLLTEVEQVLIGCALTANSDDPHDLQAITYPSHFVMHRNTIAYPPRFIWKDRSVPSKKVEVGAISGGSVLEEVVATVSSIISS